MEDNRKKALGAALSQIERQFGKGAVMKMGDQPREAIPAVSTGSLGLDVALGIGGLPYGRICEIYGPVRLWMRSMPWTRSMPKNWA